jgi:hypothetical protein
MKPITVNVLDLFATDVRFRVPIYQRNYSWQLEHWTQLWEDIRDVALEILDYGDAPEVGEHFLGAMVCEPEVAFGLDAKLVSVIDGQQRLTTLSLLLSAMFLVAQEKQLEAPEITGTHQANWLEKFVKNDASVVQSRQDHQYKVFPNSIDRSDFLLAMQGISGLSPLQSAHKFLRKRIEEWLVQGVVDDPDDDDAATPEQRFEALRLALAKYIKVVRIDLEERDNAQLIFQTLNSLGKKLTDADLIKNSLFGAADKKMLNVDLLHDTYWNKFNDKRWEAEVAHGRHQRDRLSLFLNYWLVAREMREVPAASLFYEFTKFLGRYLRQNQGDPTPIFREIFELGDVFDGFDNHLTNSQAWWFFRRLKRMDLITVHPVLLWLFKEMDNSLAPEQVDRSILAIESYLVRRLIRKDSTRSYGSTFIDVLKALSNGSPDRADTRLIECLYAKNAESDRWPTDDELRQTILTANVYKLKRSRLRMVLEALDADLAQQTSNTETIDLGHDMWIEHLLPQTWRGTVGWSLQNDISISDETVRRNQLLNTLGNLTLTTSKLDISLSNKPWHEKREMIGSYSSLALNREINQIWRESWNETTILERGTLLASRAIKIWPSAETLFA